MIHTVCILIGVPGGPGGSELQGRSRPLLHLRLHHLTSNFGRTLRFPTWETASLTPGQHPSFVKPLIRFWSFHKGSGTYTYSSWGGGDFEFAPTSHTFEILLCTLYPHCVLLVSLMHVAEASNWLIFYTNPKYWIPLRLLEVDWWRVPVLQRGRRALHATTDRWRMLYSYCC